MTATPQSNPTPTELTYEEYLVWEAEQEDLWELIDGRPVRKSERWDHDPVTGMAGTTQAHNLIVANLLRHLGNKLSAGPCRAMASHLKHKSRTKTARYPDASIECGPFTPTSLDSANPRVIFEVLSKSNTTAQQMLLVADYQAIPELRHIVFLEQDRPSAVLWTRNDDGWRADVVAGIDAALAFDEPRVALPLAEVYEGLEV